MTWDISVSRGRSRARCVPSDPRRNSRAALPVPARRGISGPMGSLPATRVPRVIAQVVGKAIVAPVWGSTRASCPTSPCRHTSSNISSRAHLRLKLPCRRVTVLQHCLLVLQQCQPYYPRYRLLQQCQQYCLPSVRSRRQNQQSSRLAILPRRQ